MNKARLDAAIVEAERFLYRALAVRAGLKNPESYGQGKLNGAAKRASLDLSRALADFRKSRYE